MSLLERLQPFPKISEPRVVQTLPKPPRDLDLDLLRFLPWIGSAEHGLKKIGVEHERFEIVSDGVNVGCVPSLVEKRRGGRLLPTG